ncbi:MAG: Holliday junction resolvase RuvX [Saprospiraceae bacterium]|nr:Holliday junction resolvase RuvX [Saprospiraceae bacterium]
MGRILAFDYGTKRIGIAVTDPLRIIANGLDTVPTSEIFNFLDHYLSEQEVEQFVVGEPMHADGSPAQIAHLIIGFVRKLKKRYPNIPIQLIDERYTSEEAKQIIRQSGLSKKKRRDKSLVDKVSAVIILQDYMDEFLS